MRSRMLPIVAAIAVGAALSGCSPDTPIVTPNPQSSATPVFASDEEALAAATDAYAKYLAVSDAIARDGGANADRIAGLVSTEWLPKELEQFADLAKAGLHQEGSSSFDRSKLQQVTLVSPELQQVMFYTCLDLSGTVLVDSKGTVATPPDLDLRGPFEITYNVSVGLKPNFKLTGMERWQGTDFC